MSSRTAAADLAFPGAQPRTFSAKIVPDAKWPAMYRIRRPDGTLTDMVNQARARDALRAALERGQP
jgi:hypothetical protein